MRRKLGLTAALVVALAVAGYAQKPDFSGTWTPDVAADTTTTTPPAGGGGGGGRGMAGPMTIKQTADALTIERTTGRGPVSTTYKLDGSETEVTMGQMTAKASAKWDGSKLVITTKTDNGEQTATYSLDGGKLTVERTGGRGPSKTVYKKAS
ncbi:MAG TPA: hypothetical protein VEL79_17935 [Vicinamibacterales bacterium]|nr:hypothetical protein [Vicinamibacterales bacterium]